MLTRLSPNRKYGFVPQAR